MAHEVRLIPFAKYDGAWNMAADEVLLENAVTGQAAIRLYGWDPPTLSLGYFQAHAERLRDHGLASLPWVRRSTGGGAIVHDRDLTYAIAIPASHRAGLVASCWHDRIHHLLVKLLNDRGYTLKVVEGTRLPQAELDYRCFAVPQPGDVVLASSPLSPLGRGVGGEGCGRERQDPTPPTSPQGGEGVTKVIGGAQRLRAGAVLQHGSIQLPGAEELGDALGRPIADALGWVGLLVPWTADEDKRIGELAATKYRSSAWNCKR